MQVFISFDRRGVITVLPKRPMPILTLVVFLRRSPSNELHALRDHILAHILDQKMDVIGCHNVVEHTQSVPLLALNSQCR